MCNKSQSSKPSTSKTMVIPDLYESRATRNLEDCWQTDVLSARNPSFILRAKVVLVKAVDIFIDKNTYFVRTSWTRLEHVERNTES